MEAAYGLAIIVTMLMTTILFCQLSWYCRRVKPYLIWIFLIGYFIVEIGYLVALLHKFTHGGYITLIDWRH